MSFSPISNVVCMCGSQSAGNYRAEHVLANLEGQCSPAKAVEWCVRNWKCPLPSQGGAQWVIGAQCLVSGSAAYVAKK